MPFTALPAASSAVTTGVAMGGAGLGTACDAVNGNTFPNDGKKLLYVYNGSGGSVNITVTAFPTGAAGTKPDGLTVTSRVVAIPTLTGMLIGPFKTAVYNDTAGLVEFLASVGPLVLATVIDATPNP